MIRNSESQNFRKFFCESTTCLGTDVPKAIDLELAASNALGIGAASFWSAAEKDIAESPTAEPERPKKV